MWLIFIKLQVLTTVKRGHLSRLLWGSWKDSTFYISRHCPFNKGHFIGQFLIKFKCQGLVRVEENMVSTCKWSVSNWHVLIRIFCYIPQVGLMKIILDIAGGRELLVLKEKREKYLCSSTKRMSKIPTASLVCLWMTYSWGQSILMESW